MGKYGSIISQAKSDRPAEPEKREDVNTELQQHVNTDLREDVNTELRKTGKAEPRKDAKQKAGKPATRKNGNTGLRKTGKRKMVRWADTDNLVTVGTKAPDVVASHWVVEAKRQGVSMAYVITTALMEVFGVPEGAILEEEE
jgi:hypothetical protein